VTTPGSGDFFFASTPTTTPVQDAPVAPTRFGYAPTTQPNLTPSAPARRGKPVTWFVIVGVVVVLVVGAIVGFGLLAGNATHDASTSVTHTVALADKAALDSDLQQAATAEEAYLAEFGSYTSNLKSAGFAANSAVRVTVVSASSSTYCLEATSTSSLPSAPEYYQRGTGVQSAPCH
jgi:hypothetical protein